MTKPLLEQLQLTEAAATGTTPGRLSIQIMTPGWGGSGYYSPAVCEAAAPLFTRGTQMFLDHPHQDGSGMDERGNRSVRDIAAVLTEAGRWDPTAQAVIAECRVTAPYRDLLADPDLAANIGLSLRGSATDITIGEADGRSGPIIEGLADVQSVDFVTRAGRGGKVLQVLESALGDALTEPTARLQLDEARNVGQWIESRLHLELTRIADDMFGDGRLTRPERISLSSAVGDALTAFVTNLEGSAPDLYQRDLWAEPAALLAESEARHVPATRPDSRNPTTEESEEDTMGNISIEESEHRRLTEAAGRVAQLEERATTAETEATQLREAAAVRDRNDRAQALLVEAADGTEFTALEARGLTAVLPLTEAGELDEAALTTAIKEAAADKAATAGAGRPRSLGHSIQPVAEADYTPAHADTAIAEAFGRSADAGTTTVQEA